MTLKSWLLVAVAIVLLGVYIAFFTTWGRHPTIEVLTQIRPPLRGNRSTPEGEVPVNPILFSFPHDLRLTEIRVVAVDDEKTNKFPHALWHLISDSNSTPTRAFAYGAKLRGMKPKIPRAEPEPLQPDVYYRIYLAAGKARGDKTFFTKEIVKPAQ
jgi:hypothetical protein